MQNRVSTTMPQCHYLVEFHRLITIQHSVRLITQLFTCLRKTPDCFNLSVSRSLAPLDTLTLNGLSLSGARLQFKSTLDALPRPTPRRLKRPLLRFDSRDVAFPESLQNSGMVCSKGMLRLHFSLLSQKSGFDGFLALRLIDLSLFWQVLHFI